MNDIRFPGWVQRSPTLAMASVLSQLLASESVEMSTPLPAVAVTGEDQWLAGRVFDEEEDSMISDSTILETPYVDERKAASPSAKNQGWGDNCVVSGYLRMVDRLLELDSKALDSLPPAMTIATATTEAVDSPDCRRASASSTAPILPLSDAKVSARGKAYFTPMMTSGDGALGGSADILHDPRVRTLLKLSRLNDVLTRPEATRPLISQRIAASMVSFFAFAVACKHSGLSADRTKGFFTECSALYATLFSKLRSLRFTSGVSLEDFTATLVACGLKLRDDEDGDTDDKDARGLSGGGSGSRDSSVAPSGAAGVSHKMRSMSSSTAIVGAAMAVNGGGGGRTPSQSATLRDKNWGLVGFGYRTMDAMMMRCIPANIDGCVHDAVALGIFRGISLTYSQQLFFLGPDLVGRMHDLTDAFATSDHRRELPFKRVLSVLLEAISCSRVINYDRINSWVTAIIQETYVVRGLFQREELHAHVVTATMTLLIRQYQEMARECASQGIDMDTMPDFTEGDQLIELFWKALQDTIGAWEDAPNAAEKRPLTLFKHNVDRVVHHLMRTEVERLRCYYIITSTSSTHHSSPALTSCSTQQAWWLPIPTPRSSISCTPSILKSPTSDAHGKGCANGGPENNVWVPGTTAAAASPYVPSVEEESLRLLICGNIVKFLLLPTSIMSALPLMEETTQLRSSLTEAAGRVLSIVTAREFRSRDSNVEDVGAATLMMDAKTASATTQPITRANAQKSVRHRAHFSNSFYRGVEDIMHELIQTVLESQLPSESLKGIENPPPLTAQETGPSAQTSTSSVLGTDAETVMRGKVAAVCLQYMCSTNHHLRSFAISELMDAIVLLSRHREEANVAFIPQQLPSPREGAAKTSGKNGKQQNGSAPLCKREGSSGPKKIIAEGSKHPRRLAELSRARRLAHCFDAMSSILVPTAVDDEGLGQTAVTAVRHVRGDTTTTAGYGSSMYEELSHYSQLLCDTYVDSLAEHLLQVMEGKVQRQIQPTPVMLVSVKAFVNLTLRVHERLRGMSAMALVLTQDMEALAKDPAKATQQSSRLAAKTRTRILRAFNAERRNVDILLRGVLSCMLSVAWPSSGVLYQNPVDGSENPLGKTTHPTAMAPVALGALSPFLRPLTMLLHLSTLFPARSLKQLCTHNQYAPYLTLEDPGTSDLYAFHYYRRSSRVNARVDVDGGADDGGSSPENSMELECWTLFRSCWMMMSYYKFTAEALIAVRDSVAPMENGKPTSVKAAVGALGRQPLLSSEQCRLLRLMAASAAPLLRMCSADVQQSMADIAVLLRYMTAGERQRSLVKSEVVAKPSKEGTTLYKSLKHLCGSKSRSWKRLSPGELMLLQGIAELEILRAAAGSVAQLTHYRYFEVREFVASSAVPVALAHILDTACDQYIRSVRALLPSVAFQVVRTNLSHLVFLLSFAVGTVRESASALAMRIVRSFPIYAAYASALPLLWCMVDLLETGTASQVEVLCHHVHFAAITAVAAESHSAERQQHVLCVKRVAEQWVAVTQEMAPQSLFETAIKYMVIQQQECGERAAAQAIGRHAGSQMAVLASQFRIETAVLKADTEGDIAALPGPAAAGHVVVAEYAQMLMLHGRAQGTVQAAGWYASPQAIQTAVLNQLCIATLLSRRTFAAAMTQRLESTLLRPIQALFIAESPDCAPAGEPDERQEMGRLEPGRDCSPRVAPDRGETAAGFAAAVSLLVSGNGTSTGRRQLLQYLVQGAVHAFRSDVLYDAILCWKWLLCQDREAHLLPILQELDSALAWTAANRLGLFDGYHVSINRRVQSGEILMDDDASSESHYADSNSRNATAVYVKDSIDSASPHKLLFSFLADLYVEEGNPLCQSAEVLRQLYLVAAHIMQFSPILSLRDEMFGETMRCLLVVGNIARVLREANMRRLRAGLVTVVPFSAIGALRQRWYNALLRWFTKTPPSWYYAKDEALAVEEAKVVRALSQLIKEEGDLLNHTALGFVDFSSGVHRDLGGSSTIHNWESLSVVRESVVALRHTADGGEAGLRKLIGQEQQRLLSLLQLLRALVEHEILRMEVWRAPRRTLEIHHTTASNEWEKLIESADQHSPAVVVAMVYRFPSVQAVRTAASRCVVAHPERYANVAEAIDLYLTEEVLLTGAPGLSLFRPCTIIDALRLLDARYTEHRNVTGYAIRSLLSQPSEHLIFYLPQLLQLLATDTSGSIEEFLLRISTKSVMFAHQLLWNLQTEAEGSGTLAKKCQLLEKRVTGSFTPNERDFYRSEFDYVQLVTSLSGELMQFDKPERKVRLRQRLTDDAFHAPPTSQHLYLPTNPEFRITGVIPNTAGAMQSAAKCPILVQFTCVQRATEETRPPAELAAATEDGEAPRPVVRACIFKMGDDCRQDQLSLQLIGLMQRIMCAVGVPSFLYPYRVVTTGQSSGIIECVPRSKSRNEIGMLVESNLAEFFVQTFGHPESVHFRRARENFVKSTAAYSVVSFILNVKDRHNGNIMIDADGNLIHIDFGFLFDTSPGGDINFESSPFKLTTEMLQLIGMDVGGGSNLRSKPLTRALVDEENYIYFKTLVNRCYLAVRQYAREICIMVELMLRSGLPCFKPKKTVADLAHRLAIDKSEIEAADYMRCRIHESRQNYRTILYDYYQKVAEGIQM